jgi:hypothetical protein
VSWRTPDTHHTAGLERGDRHLNFYETRDNLQTRQSVTLPGPWVAPGSASGRRQVAADGASQLPVPPYGLVSQSEILGRMAMGRRDDRVAVHSNELPMED